MPRPETILLKVAAEAAAQQLPDYAAEAIRVTKNQVDDPIADFALELLAAHVEKHGADAIEAAAEPLAALIEGDNPSAAFGGDFTAKQLTQLVSELQDAEAGRKRKAARWVRALGAMLGQLGTALAKAALASL